MLLSGSSDGTACGIVTLSGLSSRGFCIAVDSSGAVDVCLRGGSRNPVGLSVRPIADFEAAPIVTALPRSTVRIIIRWWLCGSYWGSRLKRLFADLGLCPFVPRHGLAASRRMGDTATDKVCRIAKSGKVDIILGCSVVVIFGSKRKCMVRVTFHLKTSITNFEHHLGKR